MAAPMDLSLVAQKDDERVGEMADVSVASMAAGLDALMAGGWVVETAANSAAQ